MADYCVQKATDYASQSSAWRAANPSVQALSRTHIGVRKYDGCHLIVRVDSEGRGWAFSRTGEFVKSCDHIVDAVRRVYGPAWVVSGEVWQNGVPFPEISGAYRRHSPQPQLKFVPFDIVPERGWCAGTHEVPFTQRLSHLMISIERNNFIGSPLVVAPVFMPGTYDPQTLANKLVLEGGSDGLILRDPAAGWAKATARDGELIKVKPSLSLDLEVVGLEEGKGKMEGMAGALLVTYNGKVSKAGGLDYQTRRGWLADPSSIVGRIVEVECLGITEDGYLREPRIKAVRFDKLKPD